jgi:hypothetical protein
MPTTTHPSRGRRAPRRAAIAAAAALLGASACALDVTNPNAATEEQVLSTAAGLRAVTVGLQGRLGNAVEEGVWIPGLVSGELGNTNASQSTQREFQQFPTATANTAIEETNPELLDLWSKYYAVVRSADDILSNVDAVTLAAGTKSGMTALAKTDKAIALGTLIESFQQIPIAPREEAPPFVARAEVLAHVLELLASARADLAAQAPSAEFATLLATGFDLPNTIRAMQARYSLAAGAYEPALAFANEVPASASSVITYTSTDANPLRDVFHALGYFAAISTWRTSAEAGDARVPRFTTSTAASAFGGATLVGLNVHRNVNDPIPVFTQDELTLIRAEAHARANRLPQARAAVNAVRTAASLPARSDAALATQQAVLDEIYRQRSYSLFATGLHWADQRRFGRIADAKVTWLPYPLGERATNPNTPANP